ncbi:MAG: hypothetical protein SFU56_18920 [Capsulimonadales bacterium]|nr:hypothetical protein [Capsulimonadales bacterium]
MPSAGSRKRRALVALLLLVPVAGGLALALTPPPLPPGAYRRVANRIAVASVAFTPDSLRLATVGWDGRLRFLDCATGRIVEDRPLLRVPQYDIAVAPDGGEVTAASVHFPVARWSVSDKTFAARPLWPATVAGTVRYSPTGRLLAASGMRNATVVVWDTRTGKPRFALTGHRNYVSGLAFSPDGQSLATTDAHGVHLFDTENGKKLRSWDALYPNFVAFSPAGDRIAFGGPLTDVRIATADGKGAPTVIPETEVHRAVFAPDGNTLIIARDSEVLACDLSGRIRRNIAPNPKPPTFLMRILPPLRRLQRLPIAALAFSPNGRYFAFAFGENVVVIPTGALKLNP